MEKVTVRIGIFGDNSTEKSPKYRDRNRDIDFITRAFDISRGRAMNIVDYLYDEARNSSSGYMDVTLNFEQLGRYTAMRMDQQLQYYFKFPYVTGLEWEDAPPKPKAMELRPTYR